MKIFRGTGPISGVLIFTVCLHQNYTGEKGVEPKLEIDSTLYFGPLILKLHYRVMQKLAGETKFKPVQTPRCALR